VFWIPDNSAVMFVENERFYCLNDIKKAQRLKNAGL
jgi:hypothetical protein